MQTILFSDASLPKPNRYVRARQGGETSQLVGKRVVVVEDEGVTQAQLRKVLGQEGLDIVGAAMTGPEGVEVVLRENPDIVLMDIRMPGEFDGLEAAKRILAERSVCIVVLTAFTNGGYRDRAAQIGVSGYLTKPLDRDTLIPQLEAAYKAWKPQ
jgi:response regulator NasT